MKRLVILLLISLFLSASFDWDQIEEKNSQYVKGFGFFVSTVIFKIGEITWYKPCEAIFEYGSSTACAVWIKDFSNRIDRLNEAKQVLVMIIIVFFIGVFLLSLFIGYTCLYEDSIFLKAILIPFLWGILCPIGLGLLMFFLGLLVSIYILLTSIIMISLEYYILPTILLAIVVVNLSKDRTAVIAM